MSNVITTTTPALPAWLAGITGDLITALPVAKMLAESDLVPKAYRGKPSDILIAGAMGARLGVDLFTALSGIASVNGRPSLYGDLLMAVCANHADFQDCEESFDGNPYEDSFKAVCSVTRKNRKPVVRTFSVIEAKEASLWKKVGPWTATPQRMLQMRARAFALRDTFADALAGFQSYEESKDSELIDVTPTASVHTEPKVGKARTVKTESVKADVKPAAEEVAVVRLPTEESETSTDPMPKDMPVITMNDLQKQAAELWKTGDGKQLVKDHMKTWKIAQISEVGEFEEGERKHYFDRLNEVVATHIQVKGELK